MLLRNWADKRVLGRCCSGPGSEIRFRGRYCSEKQSAEVLCTQDPLQFPECKEWNESAKYDETAAEEIIDAYLAERCCHIFSVDKEPDQFLNNVKCEYEQCKQKRLMNGCQKQWLGLMFLPKVSVFTDPRFFWARRILVLLLSWSMTLRLQNVEIKGGWPFRASLPILH
jgi:hypothetical protein